MWCISAARSAMDLERLSVLLESTSRIIAREGARLSTSAVLRSTQFPLSRE
jgi:hypothetical protein